MLDVSLPKKWYHGITVVLLALVLLGPLAYPLLWKSPRFSRTWKILLTLIVTLATLYLLWASWELVVWILREFKSLS